MEFKMPLFKLRSALAFAACFSALPAIAAEPSPSRVVCIHSTNLRAACSGVLESLNQDLFLKRWPSDHVISVTTQQIFPTSANIVVNAGTLHVVKLIRNGKETGTKIVSYNQVSMDTNNLSDGAPAALSAKLVGMYLAEELNRSLASGASADK